MTLTGARGPGSALLLVGTSNTWWGTTLLPVSLATVGSPNCRLLVSPDVWVPAPIDNRGRSGLILPVPKALPASVIELFAQWLTLDAVTGFASSSEAKLIAR